MGKLGRPSTHSDADRKAALDMLRAYPNMGYRAIAKRLREQGSTIEEGYLQRLASANRDTVPHRNKPLSAEERERIYALIAAGTTIRAMEELTGRSKRTITAVMREHRAAGLSGYRSTANVPPHNKKLTPEVREKLVAMIYAGVSIRRMSHASSLHTTTIARVMKQLRDAGLYQRRENHGRHNHA